MARGYGADGALSTHYRAASDLEKKEKKERKITL